MGKKIHVVFSTVGGSGTTTVAYQLADYLNAVIIDGSVGNKRILNFSGLSFIESVDDFVTKTPTGSNDYSVYFSELFCVAKEFLETVENGDVVIDYGNSLIETFFEMIETTDDFLLSVEKLGITIYFHVIIPSHLTSLSLKSLDFFADSKIATNIPKKSVVVWVNCYNRMFSKKYSYESICQKANSVLGAYLHDTTIIGDDATQVKQVVDEYMESKTLSSVLENIPVGCDGFKLGRLKHYDRIFKEKIKKIFSEKQDDTDIENSIDSENDWLCNSDDK